MSKPLSTAVKSVIKFVWGRTAVDPVVEQNTRAYIQDNALLNKSGVNYAVIKGDAHTSTQDPKPHTTMSLHRETGSRITSAHVYGDGTGWASKMRFNPTASSSLANAQEEDSTSSHTHAEILPSKVEDKDQAESSNKTT